MKKILFFVNGFAISPEQFKQAQKLEGEVLFRNVELFKEGDELEACDAVAGDAPSPYLEKYPQALAASKSKQAEKVETDKSSD